MSASNVPPSRTWLLSTLFTSVSLLGPHASAQDPKVTDITVTARRRVERAQDVPLPITVLSGAQLRLRGNDQLQQLQFSVPSFNVSLPNPRQTNLAIRGIGNNPAADGLSSSVGIYIDGVYLDRPGMGDFNLIDIDRIEVLRGPQGTLFGKNTTAGALNVVSLAPSSTFGGSASVDVGNYGLRTEKLSLTGPINQAWDYRLSAYDTRHDGYLRNVNTGQNELSLNRDGARGQLLYRPDAELSVRLIGEFGEENDSQGAFVLYNTGPASSAKPTFVPYLTWAKNEGITPLVNRDSLTTNINSPQQIRQHQSAFSAEVNWNLGGGTLTSISAYRAWLFTPTNDFDWSNASAITDQGARDNEKQASQEIRFASPAGGNFDYVAGLYGFWRRESAQSFTLYGPDYSEGLGHLGNPILNNAYTQTVADPTTHSIAAFGQGTYHATPKLDFTVGLRETYETNNEAIKRYALATSNAGVVPATLLPYAGSLSIENANYAALGSVSYKLSADHLLYASASRGAKAGGFNSPAVPQTVTGAILPTSALIVQPEKVSDFELGSKNSFLDNSLIINGDLFWTVVEDYQANTVLTSPTGFIAAVTNVGAVRSRGAEADATYRVTPDLTLNGAVALNDTRYLSFSDAPAVEGSVAATQNLTGKDVVGASRLTFNVAATYRTMLNDQQDVYGVISYGYKSGFFGNIDDSTYSWVKPVGLTDARIGTTYDGEKLDLSLWVKNAFDQRYFNTVLAAATGSGGYTAGSGDPRTYGVTLATHF